MMWLRNIWLSRTLLCLALYLSLVILFSITTNRLPIVPTRPHFIGRHTERSAAQMRLNAIRLPRTKHKLLWQNSITMVQNHRGRLHSLKNHHDWSSVSKETSLGKTNDEGPGRMAAVGNRVHRIPETAHIKPVMALKADRIFQSQKMTKGDLNERLINRNSKSANYFITMSQQPKQDKMLHESPIKKQKRKVAGNNVWRTAPKSVFHAWKMSKNKTTSKDLLSSEAYAGLPIKNATSPQFYKQDRNGASRQRTHLATSQTASFCPRIPKGPNMLPNVLLVGRHHIVLRDIPMKVLEEKYINVSFGGWWKPKGCTSKWRVAIVIPYRDRESHLRILINNLHPFLQKQRVSYRIFVIEQAPPVIFNRAILMNIGFKEAQMLSKFDCFIFHDVDLIPEDLRNLYTCSNYPRHLAVAMNKYQYRMPYWSYFGGAIALTKHQMLDINGFSNVLFGWGGEDDDMFYRVYMKFGKVVRYPPEIGKYTMITHFNDDSNPSGERSLDDLARLQNTSNADGLSNLRYQRIRVGQQKLLTKVVVSIDGPTKQADIANFLKGLK